VLGTARAVSLAWQSRGPGLTEFGARDNLLFTRDDFTDPAASRLLQRLGALEDPQLQTLVRSLTAACASRPLAIALPDRPIAGKPLARHRFWWVSSPTPDPSSISVPTPTGIAVKPNGFLFRDVGAAIRARVWPAALALQRTLNRKYRIRFITRLW
jgi:hypothetical protein